jgi:RimJ/RimL family protein N-acetyltransferase
VQKRANLPGIAMTEQRNHLGQPIGFPLPDWRKRPPPPRSPVEGRHCRIEMLDPARHAQALFDANGADREGRMWTYLPYGPFAALADYRTWLEAAAAGADPLYHAIIAKGSGQAVGVASYLRIDPPVGVIEVGHIAYSPALQKTPAATEAMFLMMARVFDELGYRRYEWKCDALNAPSRAAALRLGFIYEGLFRQATIYKKRNRDTAWFAITDREWPALKRAYQAWLHPGNFAADGRQIARLGGLIERERGGA